MQMIDVLKRLAELDAGNPNVEQTTMKAEQSLGTISNISESVNECGGMMGMSNTPASFSINASAGTGDEVANMLTQIMNLAGVKPAGDAETHQEIELGTPGSVELDGSDAAFGGDQGDNDSMADMIGMIDRMNGDAGDDKPEDEGLGGALAGGAIGALAGGPLGALQGAAAGDSLTDPDEKESVGDDEQSPVADMADEVEDMATELANLNREENENYDNSPDEEIRGHTYGDDQVTPKPQGFKQRVGDNPYKPVAESVDAVTLDLLKAYEAFKNAQ